MQSVRDCRAVREDDADRNETVETASLAIDRLDRSMVAGDVLVGPVEASPRGGRRVAILTFGFIHVASLGIAGVRTMCAWAIVPAVLRLRFDNLRGAWLVHQRDNVWGYTVGVAVGPGYSFQLNPAARYR